MKKTSSSTTSGEGNVCPRCGRAQETDERFCESCGMPLVAAGRESLEQPLSEAHGRARKIDPAYTQGDLVLVAGGRNQAEAELIQGMLLEEGVPSVHRRSAGFDVPDMLAAGPRDILVPESGAEVARDVLLQTGLAPPSGPLASPHPGKLAAGVVGALGAATFVVWVLDRLSG